MTAEQVRVLIEGTKDDPLGPLWTPAATTGMRLAEMLALTWEDVNPGEPAANERGPRAVLRDRHQGAGAQGAAEHPRHRGRGDGVGPYLTVRSTLHRIDGEWQRRDPKTEKSRRTIPLPPVTVEALERQRERQREALDGQVQASDGEPHPRPQEVGPRLDGGLHVVSPDHPGWLRRTAPTQIAAARNRLVFTTDKGYPHHGPNLLAA